MQESADTLDIAPSAGRLAIARKLTNCGVGVCARKKKGRVPRCLTSTAGHPAAARSGRLDNAQELINCNVKGRLDSAQKLINCIFRDGSTQLHHAPSSEQSQVLETPVKVGCQPGNGPPWALSMVQWAVCADSWNIFGSGAPCTSQCQSPLAHSCCCMPTVRLGLL